MERTWEVDVIEQVSYYFDGKMEMRAGSQRDIYLMMSWGDLGGLRKKKGVWSDSHVPRQLGERWCHSPRESLLEKGAGGSRG